MIEKVIIKNYRVYRDFELSFNAGMNIIVGDNEAGKSTLLEAVNLALTFRLGGKPLAYELSPYLFNVEATAEYVAGLIEKSNPTPPEIVIDVYLDKSVGTGILQGSNNSTGEDAYGIRVRASLSAEFAEEYKNFIAEPSAIKLVPIEYYQVEWLGFSGSAITARSLPLSASFIDASSIKLQNGTDFYLQNIIKNYLEKKERVELSRTYRSTRETFAKHPSVAAVNSRLTGEKGDITEKDLSLGIDISQRYTWESSLVAHLDEMPVQFVGDGEQNSLKIRLALNRKVDKSHVILIEEPENHLSFSSLNMLISKIEEKCKNKQVLISTHSSYVLNKLGLDNLILLNERQSTKIGALPNDTEGYFKKLSGYDTLRMVLAKRVILVEGPSDELIVQRAYKNKHGKLPIFDGIDVIDVGGLSAKRFLDIAKLLNKRSAVVTDNDGKAVSDVEAGFAEYKSNGLITLHVGKDGMGATLEPQIVKANSVVAVNAVLGQSFADEASLLAYMKVNKTTCALKIFESNTALAMPEYILDAIAQ